MEIVSFTYAGKTLFSRLYLFIFFWISAVSGDIRKALDVCQRALILAEIEDRNQTRLKLFDQKSEEKPAVALIGIPQIIKVVNEIYCSSVTTAMRNGNFLNFSCCFSNYFLHQFINRRVWKICFLITLFRICTVKSRAIDQSTIQFWTLLAKGHST